MSIQNIQISLDVPNATVFGANDRDFLGVVQRLAQFALLRRGPMRQEQEEKLVELFLGGIPMREVDTRRALMKVSALERVFQNTQWLTAEQIGRLGGHGEANPAAAAHRWKTKKQIFAVNRKGKDYYAAYQFDESYRPLASIGAAMERLGGFPPTRLAVWFDSANSFLEGRCPREMLASRPDLVVASAAHTHESETHPA
jgi:hypothetical protein